MTAIPDALQAALADRYVLERELGRGGMATVYLARDIKHDRYVALKVLHAALAQTLGPGRFLREIKLAELDQGLAPRRQRAGSDLRAARGGRTGT